MAGKMLVERTIFCLWRAGRDAPPRGGPDRRKRMGGWTATGQEQDAGKAHKAWRDSTGRRQARAGGYDGILSGMRSSVSFSGRVAAKGGDGGCRDGAGVGADSRKRHAGPEDIPPGAESPGRMERGLRAGQTFRMGRRPRPPVTHGASRASAAMRAGLRDS